MKKKLIIFSLIALFFTWINPVYAASLAISASSKSITTGGTVKITINAKGLIGKFSITSSNGNVLSGGTNSVWLENESKNYTFTAKSVGSATITVNPIDVSDSNGNSYSGSKSVTVSVVKPREKSTNNNLKSLSIEGYNISPEFNKNTLEYTVNLESNVEKIKINATKEDGYASVSGIGEKEVQEGNNKFDITVTSETGSSKVYAINAVVKDSNPIVKKVNGKDYTIVKRASALTKPLSFDESTIFIDNTEIPSFYNEILNITLIGLKDDNGNISLFKYDKGQDTLIKYDFLKSESRTIIFENTDEKIQGYQKQTININNIDYEVYQSDIDSNYALIYGADLETGNKTWYSYNIKEQTIQVYMSNIINEMNDNFDKTIKKYKLVVLSMVILSIILLLIVVIQLSSKNRLKKKMLKQIKSKQEQELNQNNLKSNDNKETKSIDKKIDKEKNNKN